MNFASSSIIGPSLYSLNKHFKQCRIPGYVFAGIVLGDLCRYNSKLLIKKISLR